MKIMNNNFTFIKPCNKEKNIKIERENTIKKDYFNKVNDKPWGKEYLAYQNEHIGIWILYINKNCETSLHCHFKKDSLLIVLNGAFKINLYNRYIILNDFEKIYCPRNVFHGIHSYTNDGMLMEIEYYTSEINYTDKNDLLRLKDIYNRDKHSYENSITERLPYENEIINLHELKEDIYLKDINFNIKNILIDGDGENIILDDNLSIILEGCVFMNGKRLTEGSIIDKNIQYSVLKNTKILNINKNNNYNYYKIIYSKNHLKDLLEINNFNRIGLTCGCFDIVHTGHINNLKECRKNCDKLFICLSQDSQITRLKGVERPINKLQDRINMLSCFDFVDYIILYEETDDKLEIELDNIINIIKPDIYFKGSDYNIKDIKKKHPIIENIKLIEIKNDISSTKIINKIKSTQ
jgi:rfaE bifunctional protein nucleotidyltransferase chain/domain